MHHHSNAHLITALAYYVIGVVLTAVGAAQAGYETRRTALNDAATLAALWAVVPA